MKDINDIKQWEIEKIIEVANCLQKYGSSGGSTGEVIAAAFVLNKPEYLPEMYKDMIEAWERLGGEWQQYVVTVKENYMHLIQQEEAER